MEKRVEGQLRKSAAYERILASTTRVRGPSSWEMLFQTLYLGDLWLGFLLSEAQRRSSQDTGLMRLNRSIEIFWIAQDAAALIM